MAAKGNKSSVKTHKTASKRCKMTTERHKTTIKKHKKTAENQTTGPGVGGVGATSLVHTFWLGEEGINEIFAHRVVVSPP